MAIRYTQEVRCTRQSPPPLIIYIQVEKRKEDNFYVSAMNPRKDELAKLIRLILIGIST
jgi:hypothetical protein